MILLGIDLTKEDFELKQVFFFINLKKLDFYQKYLLKRIKNLIPILIQIILIRNLMNICKLAIISVKKINK